jgi:CIC family chloride channel protein
LNRVSALNYSQVIKSWSKASWAEQAEDRQNEVSIALSFVIGILVGLVIVAFMLLTGRLAARMYPPGGAAWLRVFVPTVGALITGYLLVKHFPEARGSGIPQTKFALVIKNGFISLRTVLGKFLCCSVSLASGIALGREGPSVHLGAGLASVLGRHFGLKPANVRLLIPVGSSAALAAAFNTPIAAVLFSLEEILGDLHAKVLGSVVIGAATSWMVLHLILGDAPLFHVPAYHLVSPAEFGIYAILGVLGGLGSVCFVKLLLLIRIWFKRLPASTLWVQPAVGGLAVGLMALAVPEVLGVGYDYVERVLGGDLALKTVVLLAVLKIVATATCYSSGNAGGIFGPSLFIGAMIGGSVGYVAHSLFPGSTAGPGAYALVGMGTAFAGIIRTPLTSVIMIFELTRDYSIIVPLMISNLISFLISARLQREPIYEALAKQEGVHLPSRVAIEEDHSRQVASILRTDFEAFPPEMAVSEALVKLTESGHSAWPVARDGRLVGLATAGALRDAQESASTTVGELTGEGANPVFVHLDQPLETALERMGESQLNVLPVVSRADLGELVGIVTLNDVLNAYGVSGKEASV